MNKPREVFDIKGALGYLNGLVSEWLLRREINAKKIPHFRIGARILIDKNELDHWIDEQSRQSVKQVDEPRPAGLRRVR